MEKALEWFGLERRRRSNGRSPSLPILDVRLLVEGVPGRPTLQPLSNRSQKLSTHVRASPLEGPRSVCTRGFSFQTYAYGKHNPRKMVKTWAEKEMRNLMRLKAAGIRCPAPHLLKLHVLVMDFIGWAAPRLKDAASSLDKLCDGYRDVCQH